MKKIALLVTMASVYLMIYLGGKIVQNQEYHNFADQRCLFGVNNFFDVISNLPFLWVGSIGFIFTIKRLNSLSSAVSWCAAFLGVLLVAPGSIYYHLSPNDLSLVWDRLPMTIAFTGVTNALLTRRWQRKNEVLSLLFLLSIGFFSIWYWVSFGDLRIYYAVQLTPIVIVPLLVMLEADLKRSRLYLLSAFVFYFLAKVTERYDSVILDLFIISGHSLKHLLAAVAVYFFYKMCLRMDEDQQNLFYK